MVCLYIEPLKPSYSSHETLTHRLNLSASLLHHKTAWDQSYNININKS